MHWLDKNDALIAQLVPELCHRSMRDGTAYTFDQIDEFRKTCAAIELHELVLRLKAAMARWEEVMFARDDDAGFNKYLEIATASVQARNETKTVDEKVSEMGEGLDEVFARAFPKLYPEHPVNRPVA